MSAFNDKYNEFTNTPDTTSEFGQEDIQSNKVMGVFAYLSWLVLIPIFAAKASKFARYHANQGLVLAIIGTVCEVVLGILSVIPVIGWIFLILNSLTSLVFVFFSVIGIINVANGKAKELPIVGNIKILK